MLEAPREISCAQLADRRSSAVLPVSPTHTVAGAEMEIHGATATTLSRLRRDLSP
jgi:hypothetical protein